MPIRASHKQSDRLLLKLTFFTSVTAANYTERKPLEHLFVALELDRWLSTLWSSGRSEAALLDVLERREVVLVLFFLVVVFLLLDADLLKASRASARVTSAATVSLLRETRLSPSVTKSPQRLDLYCILSS